MQQIDKKVSVKDIAQPLMKGIRITGLSYQMFDAKDYANFQCRYMRTRPEWGIADLGKTGLENTEAVSAAH